METVEDKIVSKLMPLIEGAAVNPAQTDALKEILNGVAERIVLVLFARRALGRLGVNITRRQAFAASTVISVATDIAASAVTASQRRSHRLYAAVDRAAKAERLRKSKIGKSGLGQ